MRRLTIPFAMLLATLFAIAWATRASAQPSPEWIVVSADDEAFRRALVVVLAPAKINVLVVEHVPAPSVGNLSSASRELADRELATATVWLTPSATGATLVTYDRDRDRLLVRELPFVLPMTPFQAEEAARTARTMLRALRVTPDVDRPPPREIDAPEIRATAQVHDDHSLFAVAATIGVRLNAPATDVGGGLSLAFRPDALGIQLSGDIGPSADVPGPAFVGTVLDTALAALARYPVRIAPRFRIVPTAGVALHFERLRGELSTEQSLYEQHVDPAARIGVALTYRLGGGLDVGLAATTDLLFVRQRFAALSQEVYEIPRFQAFVGAIASFEVL